MEIVLAVVGKCVEPILHYTVEPIVGYTVAPIARQVGYLIFYKHNFKNLKDQIAELKRVKDTISHEVEAERRNGRQIRSDGKSWLDKVDAIIEVAEQLGDDPRRSNAACCKGPFPNLKSRHRLSRNAKKMAANISELMQGKDNIYPLTSLPNLEGVGSASATSSDKLESRRKMKEDIVLALRDPNLSRIGVYGLGGEGKTTLVKEIAKQVKDDKLFDDAVVANISEVADLERIQGEIADFLGLRFEETTIAGRADRLRQRIKNEKSILVILDDIWATLDLDKLGIPPIDHKGCKLLLTSRNLDLLRDMDTQQQFFVDVLNDAEAWTLFEDMVGDVVKDYCLREVANQVAQKCAGLIVLIVTVARALKTKGDIDSWINALNQLKIVDKKGMNEKIYSTLEFSYNHLEGDDVKALFLLCGLLGTHGSVEYLLRCAMGLGIFKQTYTLQGARVELHRLIDSLEASCLLLKSKSNEEVNMHDIVREVAISIASKDHHVFQIESSVELRKWPPEEFLQRCTQIILDCHIPKLPERLDCPNIKLFHLCNKNESLTVPDSFFEGMKNLKVLDLTRMHLPSLPQSFYSLINLGTLCLDQCSLRDMTNIRALMNLQILSLYGSSMITLPRELEQLTHLIMLDLTNSGIEIFPSNIISKLTKLEELYLGNTSIKWEQKDLNDENENASLNELRHLTNLTALEIQIKEASIMLRDIMFDKLERYKIVVGDVWEGSDSYGASKMLKLKLGAVIHLEHWIIELIKGVEELYLDGVNGISNVLYDLNGEGFPFLKHLHLQNNGNIQHIINSMERKPSHAFFPKLETLILKNLNTLEKICDGSLVNNSFAKLRSIKVQCCYQMKYLFSVLMVKALCQLVEIEVSQCKSMKKIVSVENTSPDLEVVDDNIEFFSLQSLTLRYMPAMEDFYSGFLTSSTTKQGLTASTNVPSSFFNTKVKFSTLKTLKLSSIQLENIWQEDHLCVASSFHKLANLTIEECNSLKYLFSSSIIGNFPNLKEVVVRECEMMEQIIGPEGRNGTSIEEIGRPILERVVISNMKRLKKVWHSQFQGLKTMEVNNCEKLDNIFPSDIHTSFERMETLKVSDCGSMKEIFQLPANEIHSGEDTQLKKVHLLRLPKLKQIWSKDAQRNFRFHNLQDVHIEDCVDLEYLFPFSIAMDLLQLETLEVNSCGMNEIVGKKEGPMEEKAIFHFDRLYSLQIWNMLQLDRFYGGSHSLTCPSLRKLWIFNCAKLKLLGRQSTSNHRKNDGDQNPYISMQKPLFIIEELIPKLELWSLNNEEAIMVLQEPQWKDVYLSKLKVLRLFDFVDDEVAATFLDSIVQKASNFKSLVVEHSSLKGIFRDKRVADKEGSNKVNTRLELLRLYNLQLQYICREGCKIDPILEVLENLYVTECANLKTLVPSSVTFPNLTYLEITECNGLINLIYSSTATSLVNLQGIRLKECKSLEEIVIQVMDEERDEIVLRSMRTLTLECLPRLNSFSSSHCFFRFPLLKKVVVRQCPRMKTFCEGATNTPMLRKVILKKGKDEEWCWEGDLNRTTKKIYVDKEAFRNFNYLELSEYPELKELWYGLVGQKTFCNLKHLVVRKCTFLSNMLFSSNLLELLYTLEELEVAECDSLEAVFDVKVLDDKAIMESKKLSGLKKLTLSELPNLKHIWNREAEEMISFGNLQIVKVDKCQHLKYLFSVSLCQDLRQLEELHIESCGVQEIVSFKEGPEELEFDFPLLTNLQLLNLTELTNFCPKRYTLECPSLKNLNVRGCEELQIFAFDDLNPQPLANIDLQMKQALFNIEKVSQNLEELPLNENDTKRILNDNYDKNLFQNIKRLRLQQFEETPIKFLNALIQIFPATTTLQARFSSFETLFPSEETGHCNIVSPNQIKALWLYQLEQLEHIWSDDDSTSHPLIQNLEELFIGKCSRLRRLAPHCASFKNLTSLEVKDCNGLMYLMTSYTAKSLIHLTSLKVHNCGMLKEVVMPDKGESEEDITFEGLKYLKLTGLSSLTSFFSGKSTFIFPSLVTLEVTGCHKMQSFSYGVIIAPFLKLVEVENGKKRWKEDLNTTIELLFIDKAIGEEVEGDYKESSSSNIQSSQMHQKITSASRALSSEEHEAKLNDVDIIDQRKQEMHKLLTPHEAIDSSPSQASAAATSPIQDEGLQNQEMYENSVERPLVQSTKLALSTTMVFDADVGTQETYESNKTFSVHDAQNVLSSTMVDDTAIDPAPSQVAKASSSSTTPLADICSSFKELDISVELLPYLEVGVKQHPQVLEWLNTKQRRVLASSYFSIFAEVTRILLMITPRHHLTEDDQSYIRECCTMLQGVGFDESWIGYVHGCIKSALSSEEYVESTSHEIVDSRKQEIHELLIPHKGIHSQKICYMVEKPLDQASQNTSNLTKVDAGLATGTQEMGGNIERPLMEAAKTALRPTGVYDADTGTKEKHETIQRPVLQIAEDILISASVQDIVTGTHVTQNTWDIAIVQKKEESHDYDIHLSQTLFNQTITSMAEGYKEKESHESKAHPGNNLLNQPTSFAIDDDRPTTITQEIHNTIQTDQVTESLVTTRNTEESHDAFLGAQEKFGTIQKPSSPTTQNVQNSTIIPDAARIDPSPSKAREPMTPSILESNVYSNYKLLIDISKQNLPYLEAGVKRHPQVLDWFNIKRRGVFIALFTEVTRILRTNRRRDLTEDTRNYIKECCAALEAVDFDSSWLKYVYGCIKSCEDGDEVMRKLEETEAKASTLRNELASVEASLASLRDKASRLDTFIES